MTQVTSQTVVQRDAAASWRPWAGAALLTVFVVALFWEFFRRQVMWAIKEQADWGHTLVIPFIAGYFVWLNRKRILEQPLKTTWIGFVPIVAGVAWYTFCSVGPQFLNHHNLLGAGVAMTVTGLVLLFCGWRAMAYLWFPLAYLFIFGQTISYRLMEMVTFAMQDATARGAEVAMNVIGLDVDRAGNTLTMFNADGTQTPLNIAEACSGMRMLMAFFALGVAMAYTQLKRFWQRVIVVLLGVPVAIFVNILRVVTLALLSRWSVDFAAGDFHTAVGLVWLVPAFLIYLGAIWVVRNLVTEESAEGS